MKEFPRSLHLQAGIWSLVDQGFVSVGNFATQLILARVLNVGEYGAFALVYGLIFLLVGSLGTLITYPLSIRGGSLSPKGFKELVGRSMILNASVVVPECLILLAALATLHRRDLFVPAAFALICWQLQETLRRSLMSHLAHSSAVWGDGFSYVGQALCIVSVSRFHLVPLSSVFLIIAGTSAVAACIQIYQVRPIFRSNGTWKVIQDYWQLGRWVSLTNLGNGLTQQGFPWFLGLMEGVREAGNLQAIINPLKIFNPILVGVQNLIVPSSAALRFERGTNNATKGGFVYVLLGAALLLPYLIFLFVWPSGSLRAFYGTGSPFSHLELALRICVIAYATGFLADSTSSILMGIGLPKASFYGQAISVVAGLVLGVPLILRFKVIGAIIGLGLCAVTKLAIGIYSVLTQREAADCVQLTGRIRWMPSDVPK